MPRAAGSPGYCHGLSHSRILTFLNDPWKSMAWAVSANF